MNRIEDIRDKVLGRGALSIILTSLALACFSGALTSAVAAPPSFTEDFTTTTYMDADSTTALWDTDAEELRLGDPFEIALVGSYDSPDVAIRVVVEGGLAFVADGSSGLLLFDITDVSNPTLVGSYDTPNAAYGVAVSGDYAYVADISSIQVINVNDPTNPTLAGSYVTPDFTWNVVVSGDHAFVACAGTGLLVIDISDPSSPSLAGSYNTSGDARNVAVSGDNAFVADGFSGLQVVDISDPTNPTLAGNYVTSDWAWGVAVAGDHAFVAALSSGLEVIDISAPTHPGLLGSYDTPGVAQGVRVSGDRVFVADGPSGLQVIDISDPVNPVFSDSYNTPGDAQDVADAGRHTFVADYTSGLQVIQTSSEPEDRVLVGSYDAILGAVAVAGDYAFVSSSDFLALDITDVTTPVLLGSYGNAAGQIAVAGDLAFVASGASGLQVIKIADPTNPLLAGSYDTPGSAQGVALSGDYALVADFASGLQVIDISNPESPSLAGGYDTPGIARKVAVSGDHALVADAGGLQVIDISDPANPVLAGSLDSGENGGANDVAVAGNYAYVADDGGLLVVDISDPSNPALVGSSLATWGDAITLWGDRALVSRGQQGFQNVDISDPTSPQPIGPLVTVDARSVAMGGGYAMVAGQAGLRVISMWNSELWSTLAVGQSTEVDGASDGIPRARLTSTETSGISWEFTVDAGTTWSPITSDATWKRVATGNDLRWRSTHTWEPGVNPTVSDLTLEWLNEFGAIASVGDVPGDQGGWVRLNFDRSGYDFADEVELPVTGYGAYRRVDEEMLQEQIAGSPAPSRVENEALLSFEPSTIRRIDDAFYVVAEDDGGQGAQGQFPPGVWEFISFQPATQQDDYISLVPTTADSSGQGGIVWSVYLVTTHTTIPSTWFASYPDSGYSVDNIPPGVPANLMFNGPDVLEWDPAPEEDFAYHSVYGSETEVFDENVVLIDHTVDPTYDVSGASYPFYHVTTSDHADNESGPATIESESTSAPEIPTLPTAFALHPARPNPSRAGTTIGLDLPRAEPVELVVFDAAGRRIREVVKGTLPAGRHRIAWDGINDSGRRVTPGVYFARVTAGKNRSSQRMIVVR